MVPGIQIGLENKRYVTNFLYDLSGSMLNFIFIFWKHPVMHRDYIGYWESNLGQVGVCKASALPTPAPVLRILQDEESFRTG